MLFFWLFFWLFFCMCTQFRQLSANHYSHRGLQRQVSREKRADWNWLMAGRSELKKNRKPLICFLNLFLQTFS
jgi:hypothetical protein